MKKYLCLLLLFCLLLFLPLAAAAEDSAAQRGLELLLTAENGDCIVLPQEDSWLDEWKTLYARKAWYAPNLFVETMPLLKSGVPPQPFLCEGTEVTVVAEENDMSCILYRCPDYKLYCGWIQSIRLLEEFPGPMYYIGEESEGDYDVLHELPLHWSNGYLPQTERFYTVLDEPLSDCAGFTLEYQLTAENTSRKTMLWGLRTVWVSDGEDWHPVGSFDYYGNGTVHVRVWLPVTMRVAAIATVAHCHAPNMFDFRQTAKDFLVEK